MLAERFFPRTYFREALLQNSLDALQPRPTMPGVSVRWRAMRNSKPQLLLSLKDARTSRRTFIFDGQGKRTLRDALDMLFGAGSLTEHKSVCIETRDLRLPDGSRPSLVAVVGPPLLDGTACRIFMPTSTAFYACSTCGERRRYDIHNLDGAISDSLGNVTLRSGLHVHRVEFVPTKLPSKLTLLQTEIIQHVVAFADSERKCYRSVREAWAARKHPKRDEHVGETTLPDVSFLDFHAIAVLKLPSLNYIGQYLAERGPAVSRQTVAAALARAGMRRPRSGKRAA